MDIVKLVKLEPGHYIIAVSGGVDSMVLMHMLAQMQGKGQGARGKGRVTQTTPSTLHPTPLSFTVAHFDHGIRADSQADRQFVQQVAAQYGLPFVYDRAELGEGASEDLARQARYAFLRKVQNQLRARAIVTAHHHDDAVETAVLNLIRGTGRRGLSSLKSSPVEGIMRPLVHVPKKHLRSYAEANGLVWHEDSTNQNLDYKRNYVRKSLLAKAQAKSLRDYQQLLQLLRRQRELNQAIDQRLELILHQQPSRKKLRRADVIGLPYTVAAELVAEWLRGNGKRQLSRWLVNRLTIAIRTSRPGTELLVDGGSKIRFTKTQVTFEKL